MSLPEAELPEWGVFAQFGRNEHVGRIDMVSLCGKAVIRVRKYRPKVDGEPDEPFATVLCGPESMYGLQAIDEESCRNIHRLPTLRPQLPPAQSNPPTGEEYRTPDEEEDDEDFEPDGLEENIRAHDLLDRIGFRDSDDSISSGEIDVRVNELIKRYGITHEVLSFVDDEIERFWLTNNVGMPAASDEDRSNAIRILGEDHPKLEQFERTFAMLRELLAAAKLGIASSKNGQ